MSPIPEAFPGLLSTETKHACLSTHWMGGMLQAQGVNRMGRGEEGAVREDQGATRAEAEEVREAWRGPHLERPQREWDGIGRLDQAL